MTACRGVMRLTKPYCAPILLPRQQKTDININKTDIDINDKTYNFYQLFCPTRCPRRIIFYAVGALKFVLKRAFAAYCHK